MRTRDRGSASIWVLALCALLMLVAGVATIRALAVVARHRAESSADLAALAAAAQIGVDDHACAAAARTAEANGAALRSCRLQIARDSRSGTVAVRIALRVKLPAVGVQVVTASARAGRLSADDATRPGTQARGLTAERSVANSS